MNKLNNKGFSLVELLIAFTAITLLSFATFRTIITIQKRQQTNIAYNDYIVFESTINSLIQKDFTNKTIEAIEYCGNNCYKIRLAIASKRKGKRGGARIITYVYHSGETVYLLTIYDKSEKEDLTEKELNKIISQLDLGEENE